LDTIPINLFIKDSTDAIVMLDKELRLVSYSDSFVEKFASKDTATRGKKIFDLIQEFPSRFRLELEQSLQGEVHINPGAKFVLSDGRIQWLKWRLQTIKEGKDNIIGVLAILEDVTKDKRYNDLWLRAELVSRTGSWEVDLLQNSVYWSPMTRLIHEVSPDYVPTLETGINFYKEGKYRTLISELVNDAMIEGKPWDTELIIVTAKGKEVWVRAKGEAEFHNGTCLRISGTFQDIDEKKKIELKYKKTAERLKIATNKANIGIWDYDISENQLIWDENMYSLYGVKKEEFSGVYDAWEAVVHPDDKENGRMQIEHAISGEKEFDTEFRVIWPNGAVKYIRAIAETERDSNGNAIRMIGVNWDITRSKMAELKLIESSERLNVATQTAKIGIWDLQIEENRVNCNDNMYSMYDIPKDSSDLLGEWMKRIHPEDQEQVQEELAATIAGEKPFNTQFRGVKPNGKTIHLVAFGAAQKNQSGQIVKIIGSNWDITELRSTKLKLEQSQESFKLTFQNSVAGMALVGLDGKWISVNQGLCDSFGYTQEELKKITWQDITHPDDMDSDLALFQQVLREEISTYQLEKRYYHKNGSLIYTLLTVSAAKDLDGKLSHLISQVLDITSRKKAERELKQALEVTNTQNKSLLNFAHIVSHNLRSHSSNMSMLTKFLLDENDEEERQNIQNMLVDATKSLSDTIANLNEVVHVKTNASENMTPMNLLQTLNNIEHSIQGLLKKENAVTKIRVCSSHNVSVVPAYLENVLLNLYTNALKYRSPNRDPVLHISSEQKEDTIVIEFKDNGQGIDLKRHRDKLFGMYKTFHKHTEAKGIGLFITKNQIESMNGTITVESTIDIGTTFSITLKKV